MTDFNGDGFNSHWPLMYCVFAFAMGFIIFLAANEASVGARKANSAMNSAHRCWLCGNLISVEIGATSDIACAPGILVSID